MKTATYTRGGEATGTSLQGYVTTDYTTLVQLFGEPYSDCDYKSDAEWIITTAHGVATIYNYKDGKNYLGEEGLNKEDIKEWQIGGKNTDVVSFIQNLVTAYDSAKPYTTEALIAQNESYHHQHYVNESDVTYANVYRTLVQVSRSHHAPKAGDILMVDGKRQHIDATENEYIARGKVTVCESAYTPFICAKVSDSKTTLALSTSGGAWYTVEAEKLTLTGQAKKTFCFFGHSGATANGAVDFTALVNVWEIKK